MNYFLKNRNLRLLTVIVVLCLMLTMLAGCQRKEPEQTSDPTETTPGLVVVDPTTEPTTEPTETTSPINDNMAIVKDQLNVRSSPSTGAKIIGYLDPGTQVEIIKTETYMGVEWALIREGWIVLDYVEMLNGGDVSKPDETEPEETKPQEPVNNNTNTNSTKGTITANGLNIRKEPNTTSDVVGSYAKGTAVTILETRNGWGRTDKGWIKMDYVKTDGETTNQNTNTNTNTTADGSTYFITGSELNIRSEASTNGNIVGQYKRGDQVKVLETKDGWGKTDKGWISMQYAYKTGATGKNTAKGIVTGDGLNIRTGPGTTYDSTGNYKKGDRVEILEQITLGNTTWGCTSKGWISLDHVYIDGTKGDGAGTGTVTGDQVNIRSGPGTQYASVGSVNTGDTIEIFAQFTFGDITWGCTSKGWISMAYVGVG